MDVWDVWHRLGGVRALRFEARPRSATDSGWDGTGDGTVEVEQVDPLTIIFHEQGA